MRAKVTGGGPEEGKKEPMDKYEVLRRVFGHTAFRTGQEALIDAVLGGRDVLGVMPTGGGKSICYQLPALLLPGITLVVSPLISLMKDQVTALKEAGVPAAYLNSALTVAQQSAVYRNLRAGRYKIVYVAPERLDGEGFVALARRLELSLVAVDEAHCISQWGQDFRPSYLRIVDFLEKLEKRPVLAAFTATATRQVREDIQRILKLRTPLGVTTGFDRPNLYFEVLHPENKMRTLRTLVWQRRDQSGIIYCATRSAVEKVCETLCAAGLSATRYHAGLSNEERRNNQEDFLYDRCPVMVATNAFGMGIDKSNVGFVIHYNMPKSLEAYYQEAGRAGRDGAYADCILLYSARDVQTAKFLMQNGGERKALPEEERQRVEKQDEKRLNAMVGYCRTTDCLRGRLLDYFGQEHGEQCGNCGNCRTHVSMEDVTRQAQMVLSCVRRAEDKLGYSVGAALLSATLRGSGEKRVRELGLDELTTYGLMKGIPKARVSALLEHLEEKEYLRTDPAHGGVLLTAKAGSVLFHGKQVVMAVREAPAQEKQRGKGAVLPAGEALFGVLKALRFQLAQRANVPAYVIFSNATLADMAEKAPETIEEFRLVSGVGAVKAQRYGKAFLKEIARYRGKVP